MSGRSVRLLRVVAAVMVGAGALTSCGGGGSDDPEPAAASPTPSATPTDAAASAAADEREVVARINAFLEATYGRGTVPIEKALEGLVTDKYGSELIKTVKVQIDDAGLKWLGPWGFSPKGIEINGNKAVVRGCLDLEAMFLVDRGDLGAGPGDTLVGEVLPGLYRLQKSGDTWVMSGVADARDSLCT